MTLIVLLAGGCAGTGSPRPSSPTSKATTVAGAATSAAPATTIPLLDGPDLILHNGVVITANADFDIDEALAVSDGLIDAAGDDADILARRGAATVVVDLAGATVLPGIVDPHVHVIQRQAPDGTAMIEMSHAMLESGRTTVGIPGARPDQVSAFEEVADLLDLRIHLYLAYNTNCGEPIDASPWEREGGFARDPEDLLAVVGVKVFADGGSCNGPAVGWEYPDPLPDLIGFSDWVGTGSLYVTAEELAEVVSAVGDRGGQVVVHAAGERAVVAALDGMEIALGDGGNPDRHRLDHNDFVPPEHRHRYGELEVIPVVFADYDSCFPGGGMWRLIAPPDALEYHRANQDLVAANPGLPVAFHSDLPFTTFDVFEQMQFLVTVAEISPDGYYCPPPDFLADQGVDVVTAIRMMTWNAAYAMRLEQKIGSLEPGKVADLIIVAENPLEQEPEEIHCNAVWVTIVHGEPVHCAGPSELCASLSARAG